MIAKHCRVWPEATRHQKKFALGMALQERRPYALVDYFIEGTGKLFTSKWVPFDEAGQRQYLNADYFTYVPVVIAYPVLQ
jgi:hypothetical protein